MSWLTQALSLGPTSVWPCDDAMGATSLRNGVVGGPVAGIFGTLTLGQTGISGQPAVLFGGGGYAHPAAPASPFLPFSFETWVAPQDTGGQVVVEKMNAAPYNLSLCVEADGQISFGAASYGFTKAGNASILGLAVHQVGCSFDAAGNLALVLDGVVIHRASVPALIPTSTASMYLGAAASGSEQLSGLAQGFALYPRALTPAEWRANYLAAFPTTTAFQRALLARLPENLLPLDDAPGSTSARNLGSRGVAGTILTPRTSQGMALPGGYASMPFDATLNSRVVLGNNSMAAGPFTYVAQVMNVGTDCTIIACHPANTRYNLRLASSFLVATGGSSSFAVPHDGAPHLLAVTCDGPDVGAAITFSIDGVPAGAVTVTATDSSVASCIGWSHNDGSPSGVIACAATFPTVLTAADFAALNEATWALESQAGTPSGAAAGPRARAALAGSSGTPNRAAGAARGAVAARSAGSTPASSAGVLLGQAGMFSRSTTPSAAAGVPRGAASLRGEGTTPLGADGRPWVRPVPGCAEVTDEAETVGLVTDDCC